MGKPDFAKLKLEPQWSDARDRAVLARIEERRQSNRRAAVMVGVTLIAAAAIALFVVRSMKKEVTAAPAPTPSTTIDQQQHVAEVTAVAPETDFVRDDERSYTLSRGSARFVVPHDEKRPFKVHAGDVLVEDLGTIFTVSRSSNGDIAVSVEEGRVRVTRGVEVSELGRGASGTWRAKALLPDEDRKPDGGLAKGKVPAWRSLAESGDYNKAYESLQKSKSTVRDDTGDLLLAADAARLSGHAADSIPYLEQVLAKHGSDPRAGLAAFTLGRVELDELGRPKEAADAFARARKGGGPLAEDALAREVEARSRAGDTAQARTLALEYQKLYPDGRRKAAVLRFGGIE